MTMDSNQTAQVASACPDNGVPSHEPRARYVVPVVEHLGRWSALTLQQSVPIGMFSRPQL